jgi:hypothetical protein
MVQALEMGSGTKRFIFCVCYFYAFVILDLIPDSGIEISDLPFGLRICPFACDV